MRGQVTPEHQPSADAIRAEAVHRLKVCALHDLRGLLEYNDRALKMGDGSWSAYRAEIRRCLADLNLE